MSEIITQLVAWQPKIALLGTNSTLKKRLKKVFEEMNFEVVVEPTATDFDEAYKIIWLLVESNKNSPDYQQLRFKLHKYQQKVVIIAPILSGVATLPDDIYRDWQTDFQAQQELMLDCNYYFPKSLFIFGENIVGDESLPSPLKYFANQASETRIYDPDIELSFLDEESFVKSIKPSMFGSSSPVSLLIKSQKIPTSLLFQKITEKFFAYYQINLQTALNSLNEKNSAPFSVVEKSVSQDMDEVVRAFVNGRLHQKITKNQQSAAKFEKSQQLKPIVLRDSVVESGTRSPVEPPQPPAPVEKVVATSSPEEIDTELEKIFQTTRKTQKISRIERVAKKQTKFEHKSKRKTAMFYLGLSFMGSGLGVIFLIFVFIITNSWLTRTLSATLASGELSPKLPMATKLLRIQTQSYGVLFDLERVSQAGELVELSQNVQDSLVGTAQISSLTNQLTLTVLGNSGGDLASLQSQILGIAQRTYASLSLVQASLDHSLLFDTEAASDENDEWFEQYKNELSDLRKALSAQQQLLPILPALTGAEQRKTYAVLLQNEQELRPTGGFIQAVGVLTFERGQLITSQVNSVYQIDNQLRGVVATPDEVRKYLSEERFFLRDSNWDPDFANSAQESIKFIEDGLGVELDGVVTLNLHTFQKILKNLGPLEVSEFNEVVTDKNLFERMEFHSEVVLANNSQNKDYSSVLLSALFQKITSLSQDQAGMLLSALGDELTGNQMFVYLSDENHQQTISSLGWGGEILTPDCPTQLSSVDCQVSSIAQIEANVGVNKANNYIKRSINHGVVVGKASARHSREVLLENTANSNAWPKGSYSSYIRFFIDKNSTLEGVSIDGLAVPRDAINQYFQGDKKVVGILVNVPIAQQRKLNLSYSTPVPTAEKFSYALFNQVQAGIDPSPTNINISFEAGVTPTIITPAPDSESPIVFNQTELGHGFYGVSVQY